MATGKDLGALVGQIGADIREWEKAAMTMQKDLDKIEKRGQKMSRSLAQSLDKAGKKMQSVGKQMTMYISAPLTAVAGLAIKTAADFETLRTSMDILNGSVEEGARNFERLQEFSARTPFQLQDLARAQNMLQGFGLEADRAFESISMIGDIAAVSGGSIEGIGIAFGQAAAEGKLMTRDIRQLINQGVPAIKLLADSMGVAQSEVLKLAEEGEISFDILVKSFEKATSAGGMFANGMQKQSRTINGLLSTLRDNFTIALGEIGTSLVDTFELRDVVSNLTKLVQRAIDWFDALSEQTRKTAFYMAGLLGASGPILVALGVLTSALAAISWPVVLGVAAFGTAVTMIVKHWESIVEYFTTGSGAQVWEELQGSAERMFTSLQSIVSDSIDIIIRFWDEFGENIVSTIEISFKAVIGIIELAFGRIERLMGVLNNTVDTELNVFEDHWLTTLDKISTKVDQFLLNQGKKLLQTFGVLDTEYDKLRKEFEKRGLEFDVGFIVTEDDLDDMRRFLAKVEAMERNVQFRADLKSARTGTFDAMMEEIRGRDVVIEPDIQFPDLDLGRKMSLAQAPKVPIQIPKDNIISELEELDAYINEIAEEFELGEKMFVPMSQGLQFANMLADQFTSSFGQGMANVVVQGERLIDVLNNIGKLLLSSAIQTGLSLLLSGGLSGGGFFGSGGGLFGSIFKAIGVNDALIQPDGSVIQFHRNDTIIATQDPDKLGGTMLGAQVIENVLNLDGTVVWKNQKQVNNRRRR